MVFNNCLCQNLGWFGNFSLCYILVCRLMLYFMVSREINNWLINLQNFVVFKTVLCLLFVCKLLLYVVISRNFISWQDLLGFRTFFTEIIRCTLVICKFKNTLYIFYAARGIFYKLYKFSMRNSWLAVFRKNSNLFLRTMKWFKTLFNMLTSVKQVVCIILRCLFSFRKLNSDLLQLIVWLYSAYVDYVEYEFFLLEIFESLRTMRDLCTYVFTYADFVFCDFCFILWFNCISDCHDQCRKKKWFFDYLSRNERLVEKLMEFCCIRLIYQIHYIVVDGLLLDHDNKGCNDIVLQIVLFVLYTPLVSCLAYLIRKSVEVFVQKLILYIQNLWWVVLQLLGQMCKNIKEFLIYMYFVYSTNLSGKATCSTILLFCWVTFIDPAVFTFSQVPYNVGTVFYFVLFVYHYGLYCSHMRNLGLILERIFLVDILDKMCVSLFKLFLENLEILFYFLQYDYNNSRIEIYWYFGLFSTYIICITFVLTNVGNASRRDGLRKFQITKVNFCVILKLLWLAFLLIILANDIESNPGPHMDSIRFLSANTQDIMGRKKLPLIKSDWYTKNYDLYMFCETWLTLDIADTEFMKEGFSVFRRDRCGMQRGGVVIMARPDLNFKRVEFPNLSSEILVVECNSLVVISFYRPEWCKQIFINDLRKVLIWLSKERTNSHILLAGDANMKEVKDWDIGFVLPSQSGTTICREFVSVLQDFSLVQKVCTPTRGNNILDLAITNVPDCVDVEVEPGVSDHHCVVGSYKVRLEKRSVVPHKVRCWSKANWVDLKDFVTDKFLNFDQFIANHCVEESWNFFRGILADVLDQIPFKLVGDKKDAPFMSPFIKRCIRRRKRKFRKAKMSGLPIDWQEYEKENKNTKQVIRHGKENFYNKLLDNSFDNKRFFALVNKNKVDKVNIPDINYKGRIYSLAQDKAQVFNSYFGSVFQQESLDFIPSKGISSYLEAPELSFDVSGVRHQLITLKSGKACGSDGIPGVLLKTLADELALPLTLFFRKCYSDGSCPKGWKNAFVCPVYKHKGSRSEPTSYRPVSLTPICSKVFEHIMVSNLMRFVEEQSVLKDEQHGFRKGRSCELQLAMFVDDLYKSYNLNFQTDAVFLDMAKAFDKVPHARLVNKLHFYGIRGKNLNWIKNFLSGRSQQVVIEGNKSSQIAVTSGVPQGSVLGPFLFLIYINDIVDELSNNVKMRLFADDCVVYVSYDTLQAESSSNNLQGVLDNIVVWADKWMMEFNPKKSALLRFSRKRSCKKTVYNMSRTSIPVEEKYKYLGVVISDTLRWDKHIESISAKTSQSLGFFKRNLKGCTTKVKSKVYETCIRPQIEYASVVWGPMKRIGAQRCVVEENIERVQKRAARWVLSDYNFRSSVSEMQERLGWESLARRRMVDRVCFIHKGVYGLYNLSGYISFRQPGDFRNIHSKSLFVLQTRLDPVQASIFVRGAREFNCLSNSLVSISDPKGFRNEISEMRSIDCMT